MDTAGQSPVPTGFRLYADRRVLAMLFLGFSSGLPFPLVFSTLTAWLATAGVSKASIGMFAWAGLAYSLKFVWAPLVDRLPLPLLTARLGRRRSWMLVAQLGVAGTLLLMAVTDPRNSLTFIATLTVMLAWFSATQDIAIDAWRIEAIPARWQGAMAAAYQLGYRLAVLVASAGALYIADLVAWESAYRTMAGMMAIGFVAVIAIQEPLAIDRPEAVGYGSVAAWFTTAVAGPFLEFFRRSGRWGIVLLLFISSYRVSDMLLGGMATAFYVDIGFSLSQIATVTKVFGFVVTLTGAALGGVVVARYGAVRPLVPGAIMLAGASLFFAALAVAGPDLRFLIMAICVDNLVAGFVGSLFIAYLSSLTNVSYTATQYALFSSLMVLPGRLLAGFSGQIVESLGWVSFFFYTAAAGIPAMLLALLVVRRERRAA